MQSEVKFLLVGYGNIGRRHAMQMQRVGVLMAVVEPDAGRAAEAANDCACGVFASLPEALNAGLHYTVATICTPNGLHTAQSIQCLKAGLHVLCEKPMAIRVADAEQMLATAAISGKQLWVVKQNRFNPPVQAVRQLLATGKMGRLLSVQINCFWNRNAGYYHDSWKGTMALDGGTLFTQFSHFVDLLLWLCGPVEKVEAMAANLHHQGTIEFEDTGLVNMQMANGALANLHYSVNSFRQNAEGSITLLWENATVKIGGPYLNKIDYAFLPDGLSVQVAEGHAPNLYPQGYQGTMSNHPLVYDNLVQVLAGKEEAHASAQEGLETVALIARIYEAMKQPRP